MVNRSLAIAILPHQEAANVIRGDWAAWGLSTMYRGEKLRQLIVQSLFLSTVRCSPDQGHQTVNSVVQTACVNIFPVTGGARYL